MDKNAIKIEKLENRIAAVKKEIKKLAEKRRLQQYRLFNLQYRLNQLTKKPFTLD